ncbi:MAG: hypothetical protein ACE5FG_15950 [Myxococcota bacterium]
MNRRRTGQDSYECTLPFESERIHAVAVYCSDGRFGEHFDDFLVRGLGLPRCDRLVVAGGPACLIDHEQAGLGRHAAVADLCFLVEAHELSRVILIAHEGCAFYTTLLDEQPPGLEPLQRSDLVRAATTVRTETRLRAVEAYFARIVPAGGVRFEPVAV